MVVTGTAHNTLPPEYHTTTDMGRTLIAFFFLCRCNHCSKKTNLLHYFCCKNGIILTQMPRGMLMKMRYSQQNKMFLTKLLHPTWIWNNPHVWVAYIASNRVPILYGRWTVIRSSHPFKRICLWFCLADYSLEMASTEDSMKTSHVIPGLLHVALLQPSATVLPLHFEEKIMLFHSTLASSQWHPQPPF